MAYGLPRPRPLNPPRAGGADGVVVEEESALSPQPPPVEPASLPHPPPLARAPPHPPPVAAAGVSMAGALPHPPLSVADVAGVVVADPQAPPPPHSYRDTTNHASN